MMRLLTLIVLSLLVSWVYGQEVKYGDNPQAGKHLKVKDARIYFETYGTGEPIILLHGGLFGDISEFSKLIPPLSKQFRVVAVDLRGHGRSEIGDRVFTYDLMANDVYEVLKSITNEKAIVVGFSDGAMTALKFAAMHPDLVRKVICMGGPLLSPLDYRDGMVDNLKAWTGDMFEEKMPDFIDGRKKLMPQPERWDEFVEKLKNAWLQPLYFDKSEIEKMDKPLLMICGDRDQYVSVESYTNISKQFKNGRLSVIPDSDHVVLFSRPDLVESYVMKFVSE